jgi:hypothetical protein
MTELTPNCNRNILPEGRERIRPGPDPDRKSPKSQKPGGGVADKTSGDTKANETFCPKSGVIIISRFLEPENDDFTYKQTPLKNPDIVNYSMKGAAQSSSEA